MKEKRMKFGKKGQPTTAAQPGALLPEDSYLKLYQSIVTLPLNRFIDCLVDDNLYALVISGQVTSPYMLVKVWEEVLLEYSEKVATHEYQLYVRLLREISILRITYRQIQLLAHQGDEVKEIKPGILRMVYNEEFHKELDDLLKIKTRLNWADQKSYHAELSKCMQRAASIKVKLDLKSLQFEAIRKKHEAKEPGKKMDRGYFISVLVSLSDHAKFQVQDTITVYEYCERIKRLNDYIDTLKTTTKRR